MCVCERHCDFVASCYALRAVNPGAQARANGAVTRGRRPPSGRDGERREMTGVPSRGYGGCILFGPWVRMVLNFGTGHGRGWIGVVDRVLVDQVLVFDLFSPCTGFCWTYGINEKIRT